ncbi:MAG TPA: hypothetical protein VJ938_01500 [Acidimicrobiia bacterium]|nr:hypothetical protein [Acidimicrobiia bacterium]
MSRLRTLLVAGLVSGCAVTPGPTVSPPPGATTIPATTTAPTVPTSSSSTLPPTAACPDGDVMLTEGQLLAWEPPAADASRIDGIGWRMAGECHIVTIAFATDDGAPATTPPPLTADILRGAGVLRIDSAATSSVIADQLVETGLIERIFVPVDAEGNRFIDLVLSGPAVGRARLLTSPARLEIELQPGGPPDVGRPLVADNIVLVEPGEGAVVEPLIDVFGYSTSTEASLSVSVLNAGATVEDAVLELASPEGSWTAFSLTIPVGDRVYDRVQVETADGSVVAGIPVNPAP